MGSAAGGRAGSPTGRGPGRPRHPWTDSRARAAALSSFAERGLAGTSITRVAEFSRVSNQSVMLRWSSVDDLLLDAFAELLGRQAAPYYSLPVRGYLVEHARAHAALLLGEHGPALVRLYATARTARFLAELDERGADPRPTAVGARIARAVTAGDLPATVEPARLRATVDAAVLGLVCAARRVGSRGTPHDAVPALVDAAVAAVRATAAGPKPRTGALPSVADILAVRPEPERPERPGAGRPRDATMGRRLYTAAVEVLGAHGWEGLTIGAVVNRAGTARSGAYVRWGSLAGLRADLAAAMEDAFPEPDRALPVREYLLEYGLSRGEVLIGEYGGAAAQLFAVAFARPGDHAEIGAGLVGRVTRAVRDGELPATVDARWLRDALDGAVFARVTAAPPSLPTQELRTALPGYVTDVVDTLLHLAGATRASNGRSRPGVP
ncbi:TetR/AcrR family transcriptional regulator [Georgenia muralis]